MHHPLLKKTLEQLFEFSEFPEPFLRQSSVFHNKWTRDCSELQDLFDARFGGERVWDISRCMDWEMKQTIPTPSPVELKALYDSY